jgi:hypothetical protein
VEETITLYLGLKAGQRADFEVVGLSAAAFAETVKEIAFILEPGLEVRLEFDSGTEGSLKLKAIIKSLTTPESRRKALVTIVTTIGLTLVNDVRGYGVGKFLDHFLAPEQRKELSEEDVARVARAVIDINEGKIAKAPVQTMYKQLERDTNIESVGATTRPDDKPIPADPAFYCYHHIQAIIVAIDQCADTALGNREFSLNRPHGIGGRNDHIP